MQAATSSSFKRESRFLHRQVRVLSPQTRQISQGAAAGKLWGFSKHRVRHMCFGRRQAAQGICRHVHAALLPPCSEGLQHPLHRHNVHACITTNTSVKLQSKSPQMPGDTLAIQQPLPSAPSLLSGLCRLMHTARSKLMSKAHAILQLFDPQSYRVCVDAVAKV